MRESKRSERGMIWVCMLFALSLIHCAREGGTNPPSAESELVTPLDGIAELPNGVTMEFVWIAPGSFVMGSPDG